MRRIKKNDTYMLTRIFAVSGIFSAVFLFSCFHVAKAERIAIDVDEDTYTDQGSPDDNFGTRAYLIVKDMGGYSCAYIKFKNINLPDEAIVDSASFSFNVFNHSGGDNAGLRVGPAAYSWHETSATWNHSPSQHVSDALTSFPNISLADGYKNIDIAKIVESWLVGEVNNNGIYICDPVGGTTTSFHIESSEVGNPSLQITYHIDEPLTEAEVFNPVELKKPDDGDKLDDTTPTFKWKAKYEIYDIDELALIVNRITDDGDDIVEVINKAIDVEETKYTPDDKLKNGKYRWYMKVYWDDAPVYKTESIGFEIDAEEESTAFHPMEDTTDESASATSSPETVNVTNAEEQVNNNIQAQHKPIAVDQPTESTSTSTNNWWGILIGIVVGVVIAGGIFWFILWKKKKSEDRAETTEENEEK